MFKDKKEGTTHSWCLKHAGQARCCCCNPNDCEYKATTYSVEKDYILELIRDITNVFPMSKSKARRRLEEVLDKQKYEIRNEIVRLRQEYANTPLDNRRNGWDWLGDVDDYIRDL